MIHRAVTSFLFAGLLMYMGCEARGPNSKEPRSLDYHQHPLIMYIRTVNHAADTLGTNSVVVNGGVQFAQRESGKKLTRSDAVVGPLPEAMQLVYPDSEVHTCTTYIDHYVGYQNMYGGDTTRYCELDRYGPWFYLLSTFQGTVAFTARDSASVESGSVDTVPDTVRLNNILELDILVDVNGLLQWRSLTSKYVLQPDHIHVTQR